MIGKVVGVGIEEWCRGRKHCFAYGIYSDISYNR